MTFFLNHAALDSYYNSLNALKARGYVAESQTRRAFGGLLQKICEDRGYLWVDEFPVGKNGRKKVDGAVQDTYSSLGYWEAKDEQDDLDTEIRRKFKAGYPASNIIFEDTRQAVLWQNNREAGRFELAQRDQLAELLERFFGHTEADREGFEGAVRDFVQRIPELARAVRLKIDEQKSNERFQTAFNRFFLTCQSALDPNIKEEAVREMLIQHLLTERLFNKVFQSEEWFGHNIIAGEIESVIKALTSRSWSREGFLKSLDPFFGAIENRARTLDYGEKQAFLNNVYERFFQGYSTETADTMGVVYTPQEIVDWMCASVERVLQSEWNQTLATPGVKVLDPCTGTGNFIVNVLGRIPTPHLPQKYDEDLFANEIMLLPYYVASGNIEHEYFERLGEHREFKGLCFADTLDLLQSAQMGMFAEENTERIARQKLAEITVIIGNPPYNVGQKNENDNNKNRAYKGRKGETGVDDLISQSYAKASRATNKNSLYDAYVRFFGWATHRLGGRDGIICFVSNNSFLEQHAFDGMRHHLAREFNHIWHLDLHGNVRKNPKLSGTTHNVFGIQVGVGITILVKNQQSSERFIRYHRVPEDWRRTEKLGWLAQTVDHDGVTWQELTPNAKNAWLTEGLQDDFDAFVPLGTKEAKASFSANSKTIFKMYSGGVKTNRDDWVYDFSRDQLEGDIHRFIEFYNAEVERWQAGGQKLGLDDFVDNDSQKIKWSETLKQELRRFRKLAFTSAKVRPAIYRPYCKQFLYFDETLCERTYQQPRIFPTPKAVNRVIWVKVGTELPFFALMTDCIPDLLPQGGSQCFPLYTYSTDGSERFENVTSYALETARAAYGAQTSREDIFYATYALLHHPLYRTHYAENLKRELPRLPLDRWTPQQWSTLVEVGRKLGDLHVGYESATPVPLARHDTSQPGEKSSFRVEKMRWQDDKSALQVNASLRLSGFTPEMFAYKLGNRSALDWVVECYRVKRDERSGLTSDPNRRDEPTFIVDLLGKVAAVSLQTQALLQQLGSLRFSDEAESQDGAAQ